MFNGKWLLCLEYLTKIELLSLARIQRNTEVWEGAKESLSVNKIKTEQQQKWCSRVLRTCTMRFLVYQSSCSLLQMFWLLTVLMLFILVHLNLKTHVTLVSYTFPQEFGQLIIASQADKHLDSACGSTLSETLTYSLGVLYSRQKYNLRIRQCTRDAVVF